ncbi:MAG: hypothetical protein F4X36_07470 [Gammaproteobacteria bacterium]|nr:hypothetical protein [Gammaproteobacteria bacterium]
MDMCDFMRQAEKGEHFDVAEACDTSVSYLYQLAGRHRYASARMAKRLEEATGRVAEDSEGRLAAVPRRSLVRFPEIFD